MQIDTAAMAAVITALLGGYGVLWKWVREKDREVREARKALLDEKNGRLKDLEAELEEARRLLREARDDGR